MTDFSAIRSSYVEARAYSKTVSGEKTRGTEAAARSQRFLEMVAMRGAGRWNPYAAATKMCDQAGLTGRPKPSGSCSATMAMEQTVQGSRCWHLRDKFGGGRR